MKELGQVAYEAYCDSTGGRSAVTGASLPAWGDQSVPILQAWRAAALAVVAAAQSGGGVPMVGETVIPAAVVRRGPTGVTSDPSDPDLTHGSDTEPVPQAKKYLVLGEPGGYVRPVRRTYLHEPCGTTTTMSEAIARTYAADPGFYGSTYCVHCRMHKPVGAAGEFVWVDGSNEKVGT